jgi:hypothetical protein
MEFFLGWIAFSFVVGFVGTGRKIGFWGAFFLSLILSPVLGLIITLTSKDESTEQYKTEMLNLQRKQQEDINKLKNQGTSTVTPTVTEELIKLAELKYDGVITEEEFQMYKKRLLERL